MLLTIEGQSTYYDKDMRERSINISKEKRAELMKSDLDIKIEDIIDFELMQEDLEGADMDHLFLIVDTLQEEYYIDFEDGPCIFQEGNTAKITVDDNHIVRYTSSNKKDNTYFYLSAVDILSIFWKCTPLQVVKKVSKMLSINCLELKDMEHEETFKLNHNKEILRELSNSDNYLNIKKILGSTGMDVLNFLNDEAKRRLYGNKYRTEAGFFFYSSVRHIGIKIEKSKSTVSSAIQILEALGFIKILETLEVPGNVLEETEEIMKEKNWVKMPNFYILARIDKELLEETEKRAETLLANGIRSGKASYKKLEKILGKNYRRN